MSALEKIIIDEISKKGCMPLDEYMALCLGHPQHGYYMTRDPFGRAGDFITAPEISQTFGEMIGAWLMDTWQKMGSPAKFALVECGPGRGTLMRDILRVAKLLEPFKAAAKVYLAEMSPVLMEIQKETLKDETINWIVDIKDLPSTMPVIFIGNEFLDALPVKQYVMKNKQLHERVVVYRDNALQIVAQDEGGGHAEIEDGAILENSPAVELFWRQMLARIKAQTGAALFIDYGYLQKRAGDTLQAVKGHQPVSILEAPGECDLTAHVDFEMLDLIAKESGFTSQRITQGAFLRKLGIRARAETLMKNNAAKAASIANDINRLIEPDRMGGLFKVIAVTSPTLTAEGFA
ncbi:MAG: class I SAM-dependent methyltransferase [Alphaproteobacteria bacterium]|nr:class I SAM-dependent methyltransferase [Alphaproteobacteria bacterium]